MKIKDLLPIGSIVLLHDGEKKLMINGVVQSKEGESNSSYDYMGVLYPEGHIGADYQYLFNGEDIAQVLFRGYEDGERSEFLAKLIDFFGPDSHSQPVKKSKWKFWKR